MRTFGTGPGRFTETIQIVGGPKTRASIQRADIADNPQVEYAFPKISCRVQLNSLLTAGKVIRLQGGGYYISADHSATSDYRVFHLFRCDRQVVWARKTVTTDILTGLPKAMGEPIQIGPQIWVMWERVRREFADATIHMNIQNNLLAVGEPVQLGDYVNGKIVMRIDTALGVRIVELQS